MAVVLALCSARRLRPVRLRGRPPVPSYVGLGGRRGRPDLLDVCHGALVALFVDGDPSPARLRLGAARRGRRRRGHRLPLPRLLRAGWAWSPRCPRSAPRWCRCSSAPRPGSGPRCSSGSASLAALPGIWLVSSTPTTTRCRPGEAPAVRRRWSGRRRAGRPRLRGAVRRPRPGPGQRRLVAAHRGQAVRAVVVALAVVRAPLGAAGTHGPVGAAAVPSAPPPPRRSCWPPSRGTSRSPACWPRSTPPARCCSPRSCCRSVYRAQGVGLGLCAVAVAFVAAG